MDLKLPVFVVTLSILLSVSSNTLACVSAMTRTISMTSNVAEEGWLVQVPTPGYPTTFNSAVMKWVDDDGTITLISIAMTQRSSSDNEVGAYSQTFVKALNLFEKTMTSLSQNPRSNQLLKERTARLQQVAADFIQRLSGTSLSGAILSEFRTAVSADLSAMIRNGNFVYNTIHINQTGVETPVGTGELQNFELAHEFSNEVSGFKNRSICSDFSLVLK